MSTVQRFFGLMALILTFLILPQCADKKSEDYVKEGIEHTERQEYDKAETAFQNAIRVDPKNPDGYYGLGGIYNYYKKHDQAVEAFKKVILLDPAHFNAYYSLGFTYEQLGNKKEAEKYYKNYKRLKGKMDAILKKKENR